VTHPEVITGEKSRSRTSPVNSSNPVSDQWSADELKLRFGSLAPGPATLISHSSV
jgi:hypothetical protein